LIQAQHSRGFRSGGDRAWNDADTLLVHEAGSALCRLLDHDRYAYSEGDEQDSDAASFRYPHTPSPCDPDCSHENESDRTHQRPVLVVLD
jgi:hypothetical protein